MSMGKAPTVPIIGCSAFTGQEAIDECYKSGMSTFLSKPVKLDHLKETLENCVLKAS
jgi:CheY-like chemotaxis protein